jgi:hypothetical protein
LPVIVHYYLSDEKEHSRERLVMASSNLKKEKSG